jgi:hypothetical protein
MIQVKPIVEQSNIIPFVHLIEGMRRGSMVTELKKNTITTLTPPSPVDTGTPPRGRHANSQANSGGDQAAGRSFVRRSSTEEDPQSPVRRNQWGKLCQRHPCGISYTKDIFGIS